MNAAFARTIGVSVMLFSIVWLFDASGSSRKGQEASPRTKDAGAETMLPASTKTILHDLPKTEPITLPDASSVPEIEAVVYGAWDIESGRVLLAHRTTEAWPIASLTKLLTATVALTHIPPATHISFIHHTDPSDNAHLSLLPSGEYRVADLVETMLIASDNGSAEALVEVLGREAFLREMMRLASSWGMSETHVADPTGLSIENRSTGENLVILVRRVWEEFPEIFEITRGVGLNIETIKGNEVRIASTHEFAGESDFLGGKTGYTQASKGNLISLFLVHNRPIMVLVLGAEDRFLATSKLRDWIKANTRITP